MWAFILIGYSFVNTSNNWIYMELGKTWKRYLQDYKKSIKDRLSVLTNGINKGIIWKRENVE